MSKVIENQEVSFLCPECEGDLLNFRKEVICFVRAIFSDGRIETVEEHPYGSVAYECSECQYEITDCDGERITDPECLIEWLLNNCPQEERSTGVNSEEPEQT